MAYDRATFQVGSICWCPDQKIAYVEILYKCVGLPREVFLQILSYYKFDTSLARFSVFCVEFSDNFCATQTQKEFGIDPISV
jgi:hypothetical protein